MLVWFDAFTLNIDRTPRNANLLMWHRKLYPIDHGAALFFHHDWPSLRKKTTARFAEIEQHILLPWAKKIGDAAKLAHARLTEPVLREIVNLVPESWFQAIPGAISASERRAGYMEFFTRRLAESAAFEEEAAHAHQRLV